MMISRARTLAGGLAACALLAASAGAQDEIEVQSLDALDPMEVGLPDAWMGSTLWDGTDLGMALSVLARLPAAENGEYRSGAAAELARAVLSTGGYPPAGGRGNDTLAQMRTDRLLAAAGAADTYDLLERTPNLNQNPGLSYQHAELAFALGEIDRGCNTATALLNEREQARWVRIRAFCLATEGQAAAAELTAELASSVEADPDFDRMLFAITLDSAPEGGLPSADSGLDYAMAMRLAARSGDPVVLGENAPTWLRSFVLKENVTSFSIDADPKASFDEALAAEGDLRRGLLGAVLAQGIDRELAGQALGVLLSDARSDGRFLAAARQYGHDVDTLPVTAKTLESGFDFALAALMVGDVRTARRWRDALIDGPPRRTPVRRVLVAGPDGTLIPEPGSELPPEPEWDPISGDRLVVLDLAIAVAGDRLRGGQLTAVTSAYLEGRGADALPEILAVNRLGSNAPEGLRSLLLDAPAHPTGSLLAMEAAAAANAHAETAILALAAFNEGGENLSADALSRIAAALDGIGLRDAALYLVLEQIIQREA